MTQICDNLVQHVFQKILAKFLPGKFEGGIAIGQLSANDDIHFCKTYGHFPSVKDELWEFFWKAFVRVNLGSMPSQFRTRAQPPNSNNSETQIKANIVQNCNGNTAPRNTCRCFRRFPPCSLVNKLWIWILKASRTSRRPQNPQVSSQTSTDRAKAVSDNRTNSL